MNFCSALSVTRLWLFQLIVFQVVLHVPLAAHQSIGLQTHGLSATPTITQTEFFGTLTVQNSSVAYTNIEGGKAIIVQPGSNAVYAHALCSSRLSLFRIDSLYRCNLFWLRDTSDFYEVGRPEISVITINTSALTSIGPTVGFNKQKNGLGCFDIPLDTSLGWNRFYTEPISDTVAPPVYPTGRVRFSHGPSGEWRAASDNKSGVFYYALDKEGRIFRSCRIDSGKSTDYILLPRAITTGTGRSYIGGTIDHAFWATSDWKKKPGQIVVWLVDSAFQFVRKTVVAREDTIWNSRVVGMAEHEGNIVMPLALLDPSYHVARPGLLVVDSVGNTLVNKEYSDLTEYNVYGGVSARNGDVVIYGSKGPLDPVGNSPYISKCYAFAARLSAKTGDIQWLNVYDDSANIASVFTTGCITESGRIILAGQLQGKFLYCGIRDSVLITSVDDANSDDGVHAPELTAQPTPTRDVLTASLRGVQADVCSFGIYDISGRELFRSSAPATGGTCTITMSTASLSAGSYVLRCAAGRSSASQTIIIER